MSESYQINSFKNYARNNIRLGVSLFGFAVGLAFLLVVGKHEKTAPRALA
jgi:hypothetical protein